jgi:type 1 fimbria pilin
MLKSNNKQKIKNSLKLGLMSCGLLFFSFAQAETRATGNGEVKVYGTIIEQPCSVLNEEINIDFGIMTNKDLFRYNNEYRKFNIELECDLGINDAVSIQFNSANTSESNQLLNLAASSEASGVGIKIQDALGEILTFGKPTTSIEVMNGINNLEFTAFVTRRADTLVLNDIGLGTFEASATFEIIYD